MPKTVSNIIPYLLSLTIFLADLVLTDSLYLIVLYLPLFLWVVLNSNAQNIFLRTIPIILLSLLSAFLNEKTAELYIALGIGMSIGLIIAFFKYKANQVANDSLSLQERQLLLLTENTKEYGILLLDQGGIIQNWNSGAQHILGYSKTEVQQRKPDFLFAEQSESFLDNIESNIVKDNIWLKRKNESIFLAELRVEQLVDEANENLGTVIKIYDVDATRRLERILNVTNDLAKIGGWEYDIREDKVYWSETTRTIHEVDPDYEPDTTKGILFYLEGKDRDRITKVFTEMVETGEPFEEELRIKTAKGNVKWIRTKANPIMLNGTIVKIYGSFQDIDTAKNSELRLVESEKRFRKLFKYSPNGIARIALDGSFLEGNDRYSDLVGYSSEELKNMQLSKMTHHEDREEDLLLLEKLKQDGSGVYERDKRIFSKSNQLIWVHESVSIVLTTDGNFDYFIVQLTDISSRKEAEELLKIQQEVLEEKNKELKQYAYITSHDLQEPVRTISSFTTLLADRYDEELDEKGKKYLRFINEASTRLQKQIKGLLDYSRLGKKDKKPAAISIETIIKYVEQDLALLINESKAEIRYKNLPTINVYETELKLLFQNLVSNSIKFKKAGLAPLVEIQAIEKDHYWQFLVSDNGIGIDKQFHEKVFQIFQRLHSRKEYEGSGIGLAHCKKIVELHQGTIAIESKSGEGTTVLFTIKKSL